MAASNFLLVSHASTGLNNAVGINPDIPWYVELVAVQESKN